MKYYIRFTEGAELELEDIYYWYEEKSEHAPQQFLDRLDAILDLLQINPYAYPTIHKNFRIILLDKFPYSVIYEISGNFVLILRIYHQSRSSKKKFKGLK